MVLPFKYGINHKTQRLKYGVTEYEEYMIL